MNICEYGCESEATFLFLNGKWCCSKKWQKCPANRDRVKKQVSGKNNPLYGKKHSVKTKNKIRLKAIGRTPWNKGFSRSYKTKKKLSYSLKGRIPWNKGINDYSNRRTIEMLNEKYPFFSKIEEMRYNPNKPKEIQVHCKNHNCENSKEQGGWFTPNGRQIENRLHALEKDGNDLNYFYCSDECKNECPLFGLQADPFKISKKYYTESEYQQFREFVLKRDNYKCQYCYKKAEHVHHERPQKLEPFFALDPDLAWSVCKKCHYEKGHVDECSTGRLAYQQCVS